MTKKNSIEQKEKLIEKLLKKKIIIQKFNKIKKNENLLRNGYLDSMDFADIYSYMEDKFNIKIPLYKMFGKNFNVTLTNIKKCLYL